MEHDVGAMQFGVTWNSGVGRMVADSVGRVMIGGTRPTCLADARRIPTRTALEGANVAGQMYPLPLVAPIGRKKFDHSVSKRSTAL